MGKFLEEEKIHQADFKLRSSDISPAARLPGYYKTKDRVFCLPRSNALENLVPEIRQAAKQYFSDYQIKWHDGQNGNPSNHLCDSQVCCVNFLFPFADQPQALATVLRKIYPELDCVLPVENGQYVAFEWIGAQNYLGEKTSRNGRRTRGANFTSADAIVRFRRRDGKVQVVLIEWKYTESYSRMSLEFAASGTDRKKIYEPLYRQEDFPLDKSKLPEFRALFYEPFYQLMRQQLLANEMEKAGELEADIVSLLHIAPAHNKDFGRVTSSLLEPLGASVMDVWRALIRQEDRFMSVSTELLFGGLTGETLPQMESWLTYIKSRYRWVSVDPAYVQAERA